MKGLLLFTLSLLMLSAQAFDWQEKPVAAVKSDLIKYADIRAEEAPELANALNLFKKRIESPNAKWMAESFRFADQLLSQSKSKNAYDPYRMTALRVIDYPLHVNDRDKNISNEDLLQYKTAVMDFASKARKDAISEMQRSYTGANEIKLCKLYNMGFIVKGGRTTIGIDINCGPFIHITNGSKAKFVWEEKDIQQLANMLDMLIITHLHGDHYSQRLVLEMLKRKKDVIVPQEIKLYGEWAQKIKQAPYKDNYIVLNKDCTEPLIRNSVKVWNFMGNQGIPCNVYLIEINGVRIAHNGDNSDTSKEAKLAMLPPADVIIGSTWNHLQNFVSSCSNAQGFNRDKAILIPAHENEQGHSVGHRESYKEMYQRGDRLNNKSFPWPQIWALTWGESVNIKKRLAKPNDI